MRAKRKFKFIASICTLAIFISVFVTGIFLASTKKVVAINNVTNEIDNKFTLFADEELETDAEIELETERENSLKPTINEEQGRLGFSYSLPGNAEIVKVYQSPIGSDVKSLYTDYTKQHIALSYEKNGSAQFQIFVRVNNFQDFIPESEDDETGYNEIEEFNFKVTIGGGNPGITANVNFGENIKKDLVLSFNPGDIYLTHGACSIVVSGRSGTSGGGSVSIDESSSSYTAKQSFSLSDGTYDVKLVGADGAVFYWTSFSYTTPLNTTALILIIIGIIGAGIIVVSFILLRTRMKVR